MFVNSQKDEMKKEKAREILPVPFDYTIQFRFSYSVIAFATLSLIEA